MKSGAGFLCGKGWPRSEFCIDITQPGPKKSYNLSKSQVFLHALTGLAAFLTCKQYSNSWPMLIQTPRKSILAQEQNSSGGRRGNYNTKPRELAGATDALAGDLVVGCCAGEDGEDMT